MPEKLKHSKTKLSMFRAGLAHAFSLDSQKKPLSPEEDAILEKIAGLIAKKGMTAPAIVFLEMHRPLNFLGGQMMHFLSPFMDMVYKGDEMERLAEILNLEAGFEEFINKLKKG